MGSKRIFVSYTGVDAEVAGWVADVLRRCGHAVTIQATDFRPGNNFVVEMQTALVSADHVVAMLSRAYEASEFAMAEWSAAFASDPLGKRRRVIGVRIEDYEPTGLLRPIIYVDIVGKSTVEAELLIGEAVESTGAPAPHPSFHASASGVRRRSWGVLSGVPNFTGRGDALAAITEAIGSGSRIAVTGVGGLGKTSVVAAWVARHRDEFTLVLWLPASTSQRAREAMSAAARDLALVGSDATAEAAQAAMRDELVRAAPTLVVLDDCPEPQLAATLVGDAVRTVVTSRNDRGWSSAGFVHHRLDVLGPVDGTALLQAAASDGGSGAEAVVEALEGLPLALAQAAAYVDRHGITFEDLLSRLTTYAPPIFEQPLGRHYGDTVLSIWSLALDDVEATDPAAAWILKLLSYVDAEDFPRAILTIGVDALPAELNSVASDAFKLDAALSVLLAQSLCLAQGDGLTIHPIVQGVVRHRLAPHEAETAIRGVVAAIRQAMPNDVDPETWPTWERIGPHAITSAQNLANLGVYSADYAPILCDLAWFASRRGFPHFANTLYAEAMRYCTAHKDQVSLSDVVFVMGQLGQSFLGLRLADRAASVFAALIEVAERAGTLPSIDGVEWRIALASALTDTGDHAGAFRCLSDAAAEFEALPQPDPVVGCHLYGTWGRLQVRVGEPEEGRKHLERALVLGEAAGNDQSVATTLLHLGNTYRSERDADAARRYYERALEVCERTQTLHALHADVLTNLGGVAHEAGDRPSALEFADRGLRVLAEVPEGLFSVAAAMLHYLRAQVRARQTGVGVAEVLAEAGESFDLACAHLPTRHPHRLQIGSFLLLLAEALNDDALRQHVLSREPSLHDGLVSDG